MSQVPTCPTDVPSSYIVGAGSASPELSRAEQAEALNQWCGPARNHILFTKSIFSGTFDEYMAMPGDDRRKLTFKSYGVFFDGTLDDVNRR